MCKVLNISRSSYYKWLKSGTSKTKQEAAILTKEIKGIFEMSKQTYGSPRIAAALKQRGFKVSRQRVAKLMKENGLKSKVRKKYRATTNSNHKFPVAENHLDRNFTPKAINKVWVSDITYIRTKQGWLYLTIVLDLFDRQVIGWALSKTMHTNVTVIPALRMALLKRKITDKLIFHSDRGIQYACKEFTKMIKANCFITQSMSRKANCWDNAVAESFFKTLKTECIYHQKYNTINEAELAVFEYIETWYNTKRLHSALGYRSPKEFEHFFFYLKKLKNVA
jgi:transposase InsO family protein